MSKSLNVLIVDDSPEDALLLTRRIRSAGYEPAARRVDTREAMTEALDSQEWDVVLSDHEMPRFSAPAALALMKERKLDVPVIVVSGVMMEEHAIPLMRSGARDFIPKNKMARLCAALDRELADSQERTARRRAEAATREQEEQYRLLLDSTAQGILRLDCEGACTLANPAGLRILGYPAAEQLAGRRIQEIHSSGGAAILQACRTGEKLRSDADSFLHADGSSIAVEYSVHPIHDGPELSGAVLTFDDISQRRAAENKLRESEERFRQLTDYIHEVFWMMSPDRREVLYISPAYELIWGRTPESLRQDPGSWVEAIHPLDAQRVRGAIADHVNGATTCEEFRILRPDGAERWIRDRAFPIRDSFGKVIRIAGVAEDITESKRAAAALGEAENRFRRLVEANIIGVMVGNANGAIEEANDIFLGICGFTRADLRAGRIRWDRFTPPEEMPRARQAVAEYLTTGRTLPWKTEIIHTSGRRVPALVGLAQLDLEGRAIGFTLDLTELKLAEQARSFLSAIVQSSEDAIIGQSLDGVILSWNRAAERLYGYTAKEAIGQPISMLFLVGHGNDAEAVRLGIERGETVRRESVHRDKEGRPAHVSATNSPIFDADGILVGSSKIVRDISKSKQAEAALRAARAAGDAAQRAKIEFLRNVSHEMRTPLNGILGMTELALQSEPTPEQCECLEGIALCGQSLLSIIDQILNYSDISGGRHQLELKPLSPRNLVDQVRRAHAVYANARGLDLTARLAPEVPEKLIGDAPRLRQILARLVENAVKFTPRGRVSLSVTVESSEEENVTLQFTVEDTGVGIPAEKQAAIFEAFCQADGSTTRKFGGIGLGLTNAAGLVRILGGRIWVESVEGKGSAFHFTVRLSR